LVVTDLNLALSTEVAHLVDSAAFPAPPPSLELHPFLLYFSLSHHHDLAGSGGFWLWLLLRLFFGTFNVQVGEDVNLFVDGLLVGYGV